MSRWPNAWISALASALLGITVGAVSDVLFRGSPSENLTNGLLGAALGLILGLLLENTRVSDDMGLISEVLRDPKLGALVRHAHRARVYVDHIGKGPAVQLLYEDRLMEIRSLADWAELAEGKLTVEPHRELSSNKEFLAICTRHLRAVSYQDEAFWSLPEGHAFLEANADLVRSGRRVTRIFIFDRPTQAQDIKQMKRQQELGIHVRVVPPKSVGGKDRIDFVLYDSLAVRVAEQSSSDGRKRARLYVADGAVQSYIQRFNDLTERSLELADYLDADD